MKTTKTELPIIIVGLVLCALFSFLIITATSCTSVAKITERKEMRKNIRTQRKCEKATNKYMAKAYSYGCKWMIQDSAGSVSNTIVKDTTIYVHVAGDTVYKEILVNSTKGIVNSKKSQLETKYAFSAAWVEDGLLKHRLEQKDSEIELLIRGVIKEHTTTKTIYTKVPYAVVKNIPFTPTVVKILAWIGGVFLVLLVFLVIYLILNLRKRTS
jgi:hypothetical protein